MTIPNMRIKKMMKVAHSGNIAMDASIAMGRATVRATSFPITNDISLGGLYSNINRGNFKIRHWEENYV